MSDAVDPRLQERRSAVQREEGRTRLLRLGVALAVVAVVAACVGALFTPLFDVDAVRITGGARTGQTAILSTLGVEPGRAMVLVDTDGAEAALERLPWVDRARVERDWPGTVVVTVEERRPEVAVLGPDGRFTLVDGAARQLATVDQPEPGLPVVEGLSVESQPGADLDAVEGGLAVIAALPPVVLGRVVRLSLAPDGVSLDVRADGEAEARVVLGPPIDLPAKVLALATLLEAADLAGLRTVDLRVPSAPVLTRG